MYWGKDDDAFGDEEKERKPFMPHRHEGGESEYDCHSCRENFGENAQKMTLEERVARLENLVDHILKRSER